MLMRLKAWRDSRRKQLSIIPFLMTFANACLGLASVVYALNNQFITSAYCIILAVLFDGMDGKLARIFGSSSSLGMELDSLCDAVSFCFAPAIVLYSWSLSSRHWIGLLAVGLYLCLGLFRLAKFNMIGNGDKVFFIGLPTTAAAAWIASLVIASPWLEASHWKCIITPYGLSLIVGILAILMISTVRFPSFKSRKEIPPIWLLIPSAAICAGLCALIVKIPFCLTLISSYIFSSIIINAVFLIRKYRR